MICFIPEFVYNDQDFYVLARIVKLRQLCLQIDKRAYQFCLLVNIRLILRVLGAKGLQRIFCMNLLGS